MSARAVTAHIPAQDGEEEGWAGAPGGVGRKDSASLSSDMCPLPPSSRPPSARVRAGGRSRASGEPDAVAALSAAPALLERLWPGRPPPLGGSMQSRECRRMLTACEAPGGRRRVGFRVFC